jgi:hypothetical protein
MVLVAGVRWAPRCKDAGSLDSRPIGATEDAAARMPSAALRHSHYFARPSYGLAEVGACALPTGDVASSTGPAAAAVNGRQAAWFHVEPPHIGHAGGTSAATAPYPQAAQR